jgi:hypothetical protein
MKNKIILLLVLVFIAFAVDVGASSYMRLDLNLQKIDNYMSIGVNNFRMVSYSEPLPDYYNLSESEWNVFKIEILDVHNNSIYYHLVYEPFTLPKLNDAKTFKIFYQGEEEFSWDIPFYLCDNNSICDGNENYLSCPSDCKFFDNDSLCNSDSGDNFCDYDCYLDDDCLIDNCNDGSINGNISICEQGSCYDNIQNGNEQGVDCGGRCWDACPICGNEVISGDEECEENISIDLTCQNFGFDAGTLSCNNCKFDTSLCLSKESFCGDNICQQISASPPGFFARIWSWILALFSKKEILASPIYSEDCNSCPGDCGACSVGDDSGDDSGGGGDDSGGTYVPINSVNNITSNQTTRNNITRNYESQNYSVNRSDNNLENPKLESKYNLLISTVLVILIILGIVIYMLTRRKQHKVKN